MSQRTKIEWATHTWNPVTGCTKVSSGCRNCYAERTIMRFGERIHRWEDPLPGCGPRPFSSVALHPERLAEPETWRKPRRVFVCSMSDLFHEDVPVNFLEEVLARITRCPQSIFMVLTKRADRLKLMTTDRLRISRTDRWPIRNLWLGVSVEDQRTADERIPLLLQTPAAVRFVSYEPALGAINLAPYLACKGCGTRFAKVLSPGAIACCPDATPMLDWIICGGESGYGARPMHPEWARSVRDQCLGSGVPFFFKQWGEWAPDCLCPTQKAHRTTPRPAPGPRGVMFRCGKRRAGRLLGGGEWNEFPQEDR